MNLNHPLKIFIDAHVFDQEYQGSRTFIKGLYSRLIQKKDLQFYFGSYDIDNLKKTFPDGGNVFFVKYKSRSAFRRLMFDIPTIIKTYSIDFAHFQYIIPLFKRCCYIVTIHDVIFSEYEEEFSFVYRLAKKFLYKTAALRADIVTTVSGYSKKSIRKYLKDDPGIYIIPNSIDERFLQPYDKDRSKKIISAKYGVEKFILFVSRFERRKNHLVLLQAYLQLKLYERGYWLVLLGHKSLEVPEFDKAVAALSPAVKKYIFINAGVNDDDLLEFYRAAEIFVYPSKAEGFGIPPLEAATLKIPVICSNTSAMEAFDFFGDRHINTSDVDQLRSKLKDVISDPPDEASLNNISDTIRQKYDGKQAAENFYQLLLQYQTGPYKSKSASNDKPAIPGNQ